MRESRRPGWDFRAKPAPRTPTGVCAVCGASLSQFMGHSSIKVTFDLYGHLMPGSEREAAGMLDAFLERASSQARIAALDAA
jgi:integrase